MATKTKALEELSDAEILALAGPYGPSIIGKELFERAQSIAKRGDDGKLGPALTDPDYSLKQKAKRVPVVENETVDEDEGESEEETETTSTDETNPDPWGHVSLSGLKVLAQTFGVSHKPRPTRSEIIGALEHAKVEPPPVPKDVVED